MIYDITAYIIFEVQIPLKEKKIILFQLAIFYIDKSSIKLVV